jgi:hypothetical protein
VEKLSTLFLLTPGGREAAGSRGEFS